MHTQLHTSLPSYGRKRRVLAQCDKCGAKASADTQRGRIVWSELAHYWVPAVGMLHENCGGKVIGYDIEVNE
jgi:hypothetical protein